MSQALRETNIEGAGSGGRGVGGFEPLFLLHQCPTAVTVSLIQTLIHFNPCNGLAFYIRHGIRSSHTHAYVRRVQQPIQRNPERFLKATYPNGI